MFRTIDAKRLRAEPVSDLIGLSREQPDWKTAAKSVMATTCFYELAL